MHRPSLPPRTYPDMSDVIPNRQPAGTPTGGQFATMTRGEAEAVTLDGPGATDATDVSECIVCGYHIGADPAGSPGVLVHLDEYGNPDHDADEDHAPVPTEAAPDLGASPTGPDAPVTALFTFTANKSAAVHAAETYEEATSHGGEGDPEASDAGIGVAMAALCLETSLKRLNEDRGGDEDSPLARATARLTSARDHYFGLLATVGHDHDACANLIGATRHAIARAEAQATAPLRA